MVESWGVETIFSDNLPRCPGDVRGIPRDKSLSDTRDKPAADRHAVVVANLIGRIVHMCYSYFWQHACTHEEVPPASEILMIVDGVVLPLSQNPAELPGKSQKLLAPVAYVVNLCSQPPHLFIENTASAARNYKIKPARPIPGP